MLRFGARFVLLLGAIAFSGCDNFFPWSGPVYTLDLDRVGTGLPAFQLSNDTSFWNGEPLDHRSRK